MREWTHNELILLRDYKKTGYTRQVISRLLQRSEKAVYCQLKKMGLTKTVSDWSDEELEKARQLREMGEPLKCIAKALGRSLSSVKSKLVDEQRMIIKPKKKWTKKELSIMIDMAQKGFSKEEIANNLGRNKSSVIVKLKELGVSINEELKLTRIEIEQLKKLRMQGLSLEAIASKLNRPLELIESKYNKLVKGYAKQHT